MPGIPWLEDEQPHFPDTSLALDQPNGLLAAGGDLTLPWLEAAYRRGIFPWFSDQEPILWWSPSPRMVLFPEQLHLGRTLTRLIRKKPFDVITFDRDFSAVIQHCATIPRDDQPGTWITEEMQEAYLSAHEAGLAHSIEVWRDQQLIGGLYGVSIGSVFFGESMFSLESGASRFALIALVRSQNKLKMIDCQMYTEHLARMGAAEIERDAFELALQQGVDEPVMEFDRNLKLTPESLL
jgi:leucyl/phenylalanyl-tRNA--protein transferase